ncbi:hypothetical protein WJX81_006490 [Elliptochloris bilobata]|uniref:Uncharacterized protein n=1 Tax=Elliptochloris bilobata TaxID=381761 RepID=A0AAW1SBL4_9CHLO
MLVCAAALQEAAAPAPAAGLAVPGQHLRPVKGVNYAVTPSDFTSYGQSGPYSSTGGDFENSNFPALWGNTGRNDLADIVSLGVNAIRMYEFKGYYNHTSFLDYANSLGLKVIVPLSDAEILASSSAQYIATTINEAKSHPANMAWGLSNELTYAGGCNPVSNCFPKLLAAAQEIAQMDTSSRPIIITSIFDKGFATAVSVRQAFLNAGLSSLYSTRVIQGVNMYFSESASLLPTILNNVLNGFYTTPALSTSPLIITEYGRQSGSPYSLTQQSDAVAAEAKTLTNFASNSTYPYFLGSFLFQYSDSNLNGGSTFGLKAYSINYAPTPSDFTSYGQGGPYPSTGGDFENANFPNLWSPPRNDLQDIVFLGANAIRCYEFKGYYNHIPFLDYANALGLKVIVPLSDAEILASSSAQYIATTINEAKSHPANMAWGLSNELTYFGCNPVSSCFPKLLAAAQEIAQMDTSSRPIIITSIFDKGFATAVSVRQAFLDAGLASLYSSRIIQGINMYFSEPASLLPTILGNVLHDFYSASALSSSPLIVTEYGRQSGSPYSLSLQSDAVGAEAKTLHDFARNNTYPYFLGSFLFQYSDSNLNGGSTFGIKAYGSSSSVANGGAGTYKVDSTTSKPAYAAFQAA